jgi:predicted amidohydrolase
MTPKEFIAYWLDAHERGEQMSWGDLATLTHETQVGIFGFCLCEDTEPIQHPFSDCPSREVPRYV